MASTIVRTSKKELREIVETALERKLLEILGDPDSGLKIRSHIRNRLLRQRKAVLAGERGKAL